MRVVVKRAWRVVVLSVVSLWATTALCDNPSAATCRSEGQVRGSKIVATLALATCPFTLHAQTYVGRLGSGGTPLRGASPHGTVVVAVALSDGLVLAADSRLTLTLPSASPNYKVASDNASKLFSVGRIGIATYGEAFISGRTINSFVSEFEATMTDTHATDVKDLAKRFSEFFAKNYDQNALVNNATPLVGFVFAGYDKNGVGKLVETIFPGRRQPSDLPTNTHNQQGAIWRGQTDVINRLIKGFDPRLPALPTIIKLDNQEKSQLGKELQGLEYIIPFQYLMLQDGIDFALALVQITVDMQRFSFGTVASAGAVPGVGGSVDVVAIAPSELTWVRRKSLSAK